MIRILSLTTVSLFFSLALQSSFCVGAGFSTIAAQQTYDKHMASPVAAKKTAQAQIPKKAPVNWLCTLPKDVQQKIREMLMGTKWVRYQELKAHKVSPSLAQQLCGGLTPLTPLCAGPATLNKKKISHPEYGTLSFAKESESINEDGRPVTHYRIKLIHQNHISPEQTEKTYTLIDADIIHKVYFSPNNDIIIVEYFDHTSNRTWMCLDSTTLQPIALTLWGIPDRKAIKLFFSDMFNTGIETVKELSGIPFSASGDGRFIACEASTPDSPKPGIIDLATKTVWVPLKEKRRLSMLFYQVPNSSLVLVNYGGCITCIDYDQQARVGRLVLPQPHYIHGYVKKETLDTIPTIATQITKKQSNKALMVTGPDCPLLVMPTKEPPHVHCMLFEGVLSGALDESQNNKGKNESQDTKREGKLPQTKRDTLVRSLDIRNKVKIMQEHPALAPFTRCYPSLARRYTKSYEILKLPSLHIPIEDVDSALDLFLEIFDEHLAYAIKASVCTYYGSLENRCAYRDGRHLRHHICTRFPQFNHSSLSTTREECVDNICTRHPRLPRIATSEETIHSDIQLLCSGDTKLENPVKNWLVEYYKVRSNDFKSMQKIRADLPTRFGCKNVPEHLLNDWLTAIKQVTRLPEIQVTLETIDQAFAIAQATDPTIKMETHNQIQALIERYYMNHRAEYTNKFTLADDISKRFPVWRNLGKNLQNDALSIILTPAVYYAWHVSADTIHYALDLLNTLSDPYYKQELLTEVTKFFIEYYTTHKAEYTNMVGVFSDMYKRFPAWNTLHEDLKKVITYNLHQKTGIPSLKDALKINPNQNLEYAVNLINRTTNPAIIDSLIKDLSEAFRHYYSVRHSFFNKLNLLRFHTEQFPCFSQLSLEHQRTIFDTIYTEGYIPSWNIESVPLSQIPEELSPILVLITKITEPHTKEDLIKIAGKLLIRFYQQTKYHSYAMPSVIQDIRQSFPSFNALSRDIQQALTRYVSDKLNYPATLPPSFSLTPYVYGATVATGGGSDRTATPATITSYPRRKQVGVAVAIAVTAWALYKKAHVFKRFIA